MSRSLVSRLLPWGNALAATVGGYLLFRVFQRHDAGEIMQALYRIPLSDLALAIMLAAAAYIVMTGAERLALAYAGKSLPPARVLAVTTAALGIGHAIGLSILSSGAVRLRMYGRSGIEAAAVGKLILFCATTVGLGLATAIGLAALFSGATLAEVSGLPVASISAIGVGLLVLPVAYVAACATVRRPLRLRGHEIGLPAWPLALGQILLGPLRPALVAAILYICLRSVADANYGAVAALYTASDAAAIVGHVPGGWGLLEHVFTTRLTGDAILAGVIAFRAIYYLLMLAIGLAVFAADEWRGRAAGDKPGDKAIDGRAAAPLSSSAA